MIMRRLFVPTMLIAALLPSLGATAASRETAPVLREWTTVSGASSYATVRLSRPVHWAAMQQFISNAPTQPRDMQVGTTDQVAIALVPATWTGDPLNEPGISLMKLPAVAGGGAVYGVSTTVPAGLYRLYVVAPRHTSVTFLLPGQPRGHLAVDATSPATSASTRSIEQPVAASLDRPYRSTQLGFTVKHSGRLMTAIWETGTAATRVFLGCIYNGAPPGGVALPGCPGAGQGLTFQDPTEAPNSKVSVRAGYGEGYAPGLWTAVDQVATAGEVQSSGGEIFWLDYSS